MRMASCYDMTYDLWTYLIWWWTFKYGAHAVSQSWSFIRRNHSLKLSSYSLLKFQSSTSKTTQQKHVLPIGPTFRSETWRRARARPIAAAWKRHDWTIAQIRGRGWMFKILTSAIWEFDTINTSKWLQYLAIEFKVLHSHVTIERLIVIFFNYSPKFQIAQLIKEGAVHTTFQEGNYGVCVQMINW